MRVLEPMTLDFPALADGVRRNNVGVAGITLQAHARIERDGEGAVVVIERGGQRLPLAGPAPEDGGARWRTFLVRGWEPPDTVALQMLEAPDSGSVP